MSKRATPDTIDRLIQGLVALGIEDKASRPIVREDPTPPVEEPAGMSARCQHIMPSGRRCRAGRIRKARLCYFHGRQVIRRWNEQEGKGSRNLTHEMPEIEDRASIQVAISEVIRNLARNWIDAKKAGVLLYGLNISLQNLRLDDPHVIARADAVTGATQVFDVDDLVLPSAAEEAVLSAELDEAQAWFEQRKAATQARQLSGETAPALPPSHLLPATDPYLHRPAEYRPIHKPLGSPATTPK